MERILRLRPQVKLLTATRGGAGLAMARQHGPDLILLDVHLPDMPGDEVLRELRRDPGTREIPVVVLSADATSQRIDRLLAAGARSYLTKPVDVGELLRVLDETLTPEAPSHA